MATLEDKVKNLLLKAHARLEVGKKRVKETLKGISSKKATITQNIVSTGALGATSLGIHSAITHTPLTNYISAAYNSLTSAAQTIGSGIHYLVNGYGSVITGLASLPIAVPLVLGGYVGSSNFRKAVNNTALLPIKLAYYTTKLGLGLAQDIASVTTDLIGTTYRYGSGLIANGIIQSANAYNAENNNNTYNYISPLSQYWVDFGNRSLKVGKRALKRVYNPDYKPISNLVYNNNNKDISLEEYLPSPGFINSIKEDVVDGILVPIKDMFKNSWTNIKSIYSGIKQYWRNKQKFTFTS